MKGNAMQEYNKIETLYQRDTEGTKKLIDGVFRDETVQFLANTVWVWTEKVDGTNIRVHWDGHKVEFGGRTDKAQIPAPMVNKLNEYFAGETNAQVFEQLFGEKEVTLFGEGYGAKIQNGGDYVDDGKSVDLILFDIRIDDMWLKRDAVEDIAKAFGVKVVPIVGKGCLSAAVDFVKSHPMSELGNRKHEMEGVVCRPEVELKDRRGNRLIVKVKYRDFV